MQSVCLASENSRKAERVLHLSKPKPMQHTSVFSTAAAYDRRPGKFLQHPFFTVSHEQLLASLRRIIDHAQPCVTIEHVDKSSSAAAALTLPQGSHPHTFEGHRDGRSRRGRRRERIAIRAAQSPNRRGRRGTGRALCAPVEQSKQPRVNVVRAFEDGEFVFGHTEYDFATRRIGFEIFRFEGNQAVEHWDNIQPRIEGPNESGHSMVDGPTESTIGT